MATVCIHVPVPDTSWPVQKKAKFRTPSTLTMSRGCRRVASPAAAGVLARGPRPPFVWDLPTLAC
ncbi:hypothetical protein SCMU_35580 [Sinomonas cyclohexanicum]|uniref:Uncharacterized protein n=1 Tax=Sinomonas cyclohexanicum TaxID=322009 RepID=A0ABM7PZI6_SINCY|nr:hypothetical protein SCMU_35580 [Corynebacterium cyclohexanicum]